MHLESAFFFEFLKKIQNNIKEKLIKSCVKMIKYNKLF